MPAWGDRMFVHEDSRFRASAHPGCPPRPAFSVCPTVCVQPSGRWSASRCCWRPTCSRTCRSWSTWPRSTRSRCVGAAGEPTEWRAGRRAGWFPDVAYSTETGAQDEARKFVIVWHDPGSGLQWKQCVLVRASTARLRLRLCCPAADRREDHRAAGEPQVVPRPLLLPGRQHCVLREPRGETQRPLPHIGSEGRRSGWGASKSAGLWLGGCTVVFQTLSWEQSETSEARCAAAF